MTLDIERSAAVALSFDKVQGLRNLEDTALSLSAYCKGSLQLIQTIKGISEAFFEGPWSLESYKSLLLGFVDDLAVLTSRISSTIELVSSSEQEVIAPVSRADV